MRRVKSLVARRVKSLVAHGFRSPQSVVKLAARIRSQALQLLKGLNDAKIWTSRPSAANEEELTRWVENATNPHMRRHGRNEPASANHGFTVAVKDNIITTHLPSTCASNMLQDYVAPQKATVVELMEKAGMAVIGKTNMDEFGMGSHTTNTPYGAMSQRYTRLSVGGSSGGSALAVASNSCHMALGTDTGGSVRLPAAYTGLFGFKPSYGMISRYGVVPYANSLDTVGILAQNPLDVWLLYNILNHPDDKDPTCLSSATRARIVDARNLRTNEQRDTLFRAYGSIDRTSRNIVGEDEDGEGRKPGSTSGLTRKTLYRDYGHRRIGIPTDYNIVELQPAVRLAWRNTIALLRQMGHDIVPIELPTTRNALSAYYILAPAEASSNLAKYDGIRYGALRDDSSAQADHGVLYAAHRGSLFGDEVKRRILLGAFSLSAGAMDNYFLQAQRVRRRVQTDFNEVFRMAHPLIEGAKGATNGVDLILCPTAPTTPPSVKHVLSHASPVEAYMNDVFTVPASLAGLPAFSFPAPPPPGGRADDRSRSVGLQIIGQYGDDMDVLKFVDNKIWRRTEWGERAIASLVSEGVAENGIGGYR